MPTVEKILAGLMTISNTWRVLAVLWHVYFAVIAIILILGARYSKRLAGVLLVLPLVSVSIIAWSYFNPFNGLVFALISILLLRVSLRLPRENPQIAPVWILIPGILMFVFGWIYPHFLDAASFVPYLYSSPIGLIPCATLSIVIGFALVLNGLNSRALLIILGIAGLFYGVTGVFQLGVSIDLILLLGTLMTLIVALTQEHGKKSDTDKMTTWGIGPKMAAILLVCYALVVILNILLPGQFLITRTPNTILLVIGLALIVVGIGLWALGARVIDKAFYQGKLLTTGGYSFVRHPMYSGLIVFVATGIALCFHSWLLLIPPLVGYIVFRIFITEEDDYLEKKFGKAFLDYKSKTNAIIPFLRPLRMKKR